MAEKTKERDASLLEKDLKKIISVLRKNFPNWEEYTDCSYSFYDKNGNQLFKLETGVNEEIFEKAKSILQKEFSNLKYDRYIEYSIGDIRIFVHHHPEEEDIREEYNISLRKYPTQPRLDKKISKVLAKVTPELGDSYFYDPSNHASKWRLDYTNPNNLDLHIS